MIWIDFIVIVTAVLLAIVVMMMHSTDNIKDAFSGEKSELFKNKKTRGFELFLMRTAAVLSVVLIVTVVLSNNLPH
ncbi:MAG: preprotein translocase subunit SecG [Tenericutes bacterium HGW-Tenericutes-3]|nr:MAG: preprotein translocase subunit SecG [Tenericutes bacterium HGW-Tenericutes-3]